jgi:hypothetical protein
MATVIQLLDQLAAGKVSADQVADDFRKRKWGPPRERATMDDVWLGNDMGTDEEWGAVLNDSRLDTPTYRKLAAARAEALRG